MTVLGFDLGPLRSAIAELGRGVRQGARQAQPAGPPGGQLPGGGDYLGYLAHLAPPPTADFRPARAAPQAGPGDFLGQLGQLATGRGAFDAVTPTFAGLGQLGTGGPGQFMADLAALADRFTAQKATAVQTVGSTVGTTGGSTGAGGGPSSGMEPAVAQWADQARQTFGGLIDPDVMLAIMTNESGGNPAAYNGAGNAWGLFQQVGLGSNDPNTQFASARKLAEEKLAGVNAAYAAHGLNPDERTRARDFALAWAGHFDYDTGQPNPSSRDVGSGQTADQLAAIFLANYDRIKAGRAAPQGGGNTGLAGVTPGTGGQIMQEFGPTDYSAAHPSTYAYANAYGLAGSQHPGVDWAVPSGTRVASPLAGTVSVVGNDHGTGYYYNNPGNPDPDHSGEFAVTLANGDILILGHLSRINVNVGDTVSAGDLIGLSGGSDGDHVHVEYRRRNADGSYTIVDPRTMLGGGPPTGGGGASYR